MRTFALFGVLFLLNCFFVPATLWAGTGDGSPSEAISFPKQKGLFFLQNKGQVVDEEGKPRADIDYVLKVDQGFGVFVSGNIICYRWLRPVIDSEQEPVNGKSPAMELYQLTMTLAGANPLAKAVEEDIYDYQAVYYIPQSEPGATALAYKKITYKNVYPGIDWVLYIKNRSQNSKANDDSYGSGFKYDFVVHEGGNPADIKMQYRGDTSIVLKDGDISVYTPFGKIEEEAPVSYETETGKAVASKFVKEGDVIGIETGSYKGELVIDPTVNWVTYYGGWWTDEAFAIARREVPRFVDDFTYIGGRTESWNYLDITRSYHLPTVYQLMPAGSFGDGTYDCFIAAFQSNGNLRIGTYFGGAANDVIYAMATDKAGNLYVAGGTNSTNGIASPGAYMETPEGSTATLSSWYNDGFLAKFDTNGHRIWGTYFGGEQWEHIKAITVDEDAKIYITGETYSASKIATPGSHQSFFAGGKEAFLAKFDSSGNLQWSSYYGSAGSEAGNALVCDNDGNIYMAGTTDDDTCDNGTNITKITAIATTGSYQPLPANSALSCPLPAPGPGGPPPIRDAFLVKFNTSTGAREWGTYYGAAGADEAGLAVTFDSSSFTDTAGILTQGLVYFGGESFLTAFKTTGELYWRRNDMVKALCMDNNNSLIALTSSGIKVFNQAVMISSASINTGVPDGARAIIAEHNTGDHGDYHIYMTGKTKRTSGFAFGTGIYQANPMDNPPGYYGDAFLAQYIIDRPMVFYIVGPPPPPPPPPGGPPPPPLKPPLKPLFGTKFPEICIGVRDTALPAVIFAPEFPASTEFVLQLSDMNGDFANSRVIGKGTKPVIYTFPPGLPKSSKYKVRLVSLDPLAISRVEDVAIYSTPFPHASSNSPICEGDSLLLTVNDTITSTEVYYQWVDKDTTVIFISKNAVQKDLKPVSTGNYIVTAMIDGRCWNTDTINVIVKPTPIIETIGNNSPVCAGSPLQLLSYADTTGEYSFSWRGPGFTSTLQNPVFDNPDESNAGMYYLDFTRYGCTGTDSTLVQIDTLPDIIGLSTNSPVCYKDTIKLIAETNVANAKFLWTGPAGFSSTLKGHYIVNAVDSLSGIYKISITLDKCTNTDSVYVNVKPYTAPKVSSNSPIKAGEELRLYAEGPAGASYQWNGPDSFSSYEQNPIIEFIPYTGTGQYNVTMTDEGCKSYASTIVVVNTTSEVFFVMFPNPNNGNFTIKATLNRDQVVPISIMNTVGQTVYEQKLISDRRLLIAPISLPGGLAAGDYYLRIRMDAGDRIVPFAIVH